MKYLRYKNDKKISSGKVNTDRFVKTAQQKQKKRYIEGWPCRRSLKNKT